MQRILFFLTIDELAEKLADNIEFILLAYSCDFEIAIVINTWQSENLEIDIKPILAMLTLCEQPKVFYQYLSRTILEQLKEQAIQLQNLNTKLINQLLQIYDTVIIL